MAALEHDRSRLGRSSTAERVADILRERIIEGLFVPGERLSEEAIGSALGVSRNTLREAFRLLGHERLLDHKLNRGVFVRVLSAADVADLYRMRRVLEGAAVRRCAEASPEALRLIGETVEEAERSASDDRWQDVGTANSRFHQALVALNQSPRLDETMRQLLAELRLVFHAMRNPRSLHEPFVERNRLLLGLLEARRAEDAATYLEIYLDDAERLLLQAYEPAG
ncbi:MULTISPECIES: GntR family transcriptional regulator [Nonomuraea]|uniref:DNA-binding GntR family transcriptional regulator n=1 Tax=Nonomuraea dietziae TaxID=65515 RepID=A0A7W5Y669_9ACTN|nr:GntR family transcriptional regulator [Nonomuraea dietziae]MBB3726171.1 DNA-binding GntR family transcriptional regulator [Nonomuraea dietziae]